MPVVPNFPEPITDLYADQGYFSRLQRAFETAFAAWNKVPHVLTRPPFHSIKHSAAERNEVPDVPETAADVPAYLTTRPCIQPEIIINHRDEAFRRAGCASAKPTSASRLVLWTDASAQKGTAAGWAVAFWDGLNWVRITARGPTVTKKTKPHVSIAELQAIGLALEYAVQFVERKTEDEVPLQIFEVYTDSQPSLILLRDAKRDLSNHKMSKLLRKSKQSGKIVRDVSLKIKKLEEAGVHTEFHWVPRSATLGNMLADKGAGLARLAGEGRYTVDNALVEMMPRPH
ncbi:uncharacterized protein B0J16DRAFT_329118 [Fusarium flagelliforme]|uniref:uncharacterized protein n=1 Tax=Fusarium flagelliforme TaxID=2675880 RepID=UPI001E8EE13D|nr:uncharacterized protein B0J16DRAFT_329118 [Fusarium flagelliforme]KAH7197787.1 hypothetical protein B0J16DRAFT_329118 [Fusarium flagelliforme]